MPYVFSRLSYSRSCSLTSDEFVWDYVQCSRTIPMPFSAKPCTFVGIVALVQIAHGMKDVILFAQSAVRGPRTVDRSDSSGHLVNVFLLEDTGQFRFFGLFEFN